jgi:hypothetical protein
MAVINYALFLNFKAIPTLFNSSSLSILDLYGSTSTYDLFDLSFLNWFFMVFMPLTAHVLYAGKSIRKYYSTSAKNQKGEIDPYSYLQPII